MRSAAASLVLIAALAGCRQQQGAHSPVTEAEAQAIAERAEASFTSGNAKAIMNQYAEGAVMIDASHPQPSTDRKVQTGWAQSFVSMKPADYHVPDPFRRSLLFELNEIAALEGNNMSQDNFSRLQLIQANLLRYWGEMP